MREESRFLYGRFYVGGFYVSPNTIRRKGKVCQEWEQVLLYPTLNLRVAAQTMVSKSALCFSAENKYIFIVSYQV